MRDWDYPKVSRYELYDRWLSPFDAWFERMKLPQHRFPNSVPQVSTCWARIRERDNTRGLNNPQLPLPVARQRYPRRSGREITSDFFASYESLWIQLSNIFSGKCSKTWQQSTTSADRIEQGRSVTLAIKLGFSDASITSTSTHYVWVHHALRDYLHQSQ